MSTSIGRISQGRFRPGLVLALAKVAWIGRWRGRTFLDDDADLSDIADFVPADESLRIDVAPAPSAAAPAPTPPTTGSEDGGHHTVAA